MEETFDQSLVLQNLLLNFMHPNVFVKHIFTSIFWSIQSYMHQLSYLLTIIFLKKNIFRLTPEAAIRLNSLNFYHLTPEVAIWLNSFISFILHDIGGGVTCLFHFT